MPLGLLLATTLSAGAAPVYNARTVASPQVIGGMEYFWYAPLSVNNRGAVLLTNHQYGVSDYGFSVYDKYGHYLRHVGGFSGRYGGNLVTSINNLGDVGGHRLDGSRWAGQVQMDQGFKADIRGFPEGNFRGYFSDAFVYGLSDAGHAVGQAVGEVDGRSRGYVWHRDAMQEIGTFGGPTSIALAVNDRGEAVGHADRADGSVRAFRFSGGRLLNLGTFGGANSRAYDINGRGQVVGEAEQADGSPLAFIHEGGKLNALPTPQGASARAWSINKQGQAVGVYTLAGQDHAFLYDGEQVHRLQDLLLPHDQAAWTIDAALSINDKGWILVEARGHGFEHASVLLLKPQR